MNCMSVCDESQFGCTENSAEDSGSDVSEDDSGDNSEDNSEDNSGDNSEENSEENSEDNSESGSEDGSEDEYEEVSPDPGTINESGVPNDETFSVTEVTINESYNTIHDETDDDDSTEVTTSTSNQDHIDWTVDKACWIADDYVRYCDKHWRSDTDSAQKCLEECQEHEHCQKATWFVQNSGEPVCFMFPLGAVECEWDGGQYVRPDGGQSIECQKPLCKSNDDCVELTNGNVPTYCKYTKRSTEDIESLSDTLGTSESTHDGWYHEGQSNEYEYRCSVCPEQPGHCEYPEISENS